MVCCTALGCVGSEVSLNCPILVCLHVAVVCSSRLFCCMLFHNMLLLFALLWCCIAVGWVAGKFVGLCCVALLGFCCKRLVYIALSCATMCYEVSR